jgi:hypothetical protein
VANCPPYISHPSRLIVPRLNKRQVQAHIKNMALDREKKKEKLLESSVQDCDQTELAALIADGFCPEEGVEDEEDSKHLEEEVDDETGGVFLDSDWVENSTFLSYFSGASFPSSSTVDTSELYAKRAPVYTGNSLRTEERRRAEQKALRDVILLLLKKLMRM